MDGVVIESITGAVGKLKWGHRDAATLASWSISAAPGGGQSLTAKIVSSDTFRVTQAPLTFEVPLSNGRWTWPVLTLQISGSTLIASLGQ